MADDVIIKVRLDGANEQLKTLNLLQEELNALAAEKKKLSKVEKDLVKEIDESKGATDEQTAALKDLAEQQVQNNLIQKQTQQEFNETSKAVNISAKANRLAKGSVAQLAAQHVKDKDALRLLTEEEIKNTKVGRELNKKVKDQGEKLKELEKGYGTTARNVGNYGDAMTGVLPIMGGFGQQIQSIVTQLGSVKESIGKYTTAQKGAAASTKATNKGLKSFRIALIATGIGAIVVALGALVAAFLSTQRGVDALTKVLRPLQEIMNSILGVVQNLATSGLDRLKKAFADPKQAVIDLGNAIKDNLITRILAVPKLIKAAAGAYINSFKLIGLGIKKVLSDVPLIGKFIDKEQLEKDLETAKQEVTSSFSELKDATIELSLGVDAEKVKEAASAVGDFFGEAAERGSEIDRITKQIERAGISLNREREKGLLIFAQQKKIAEDTNATTQEQLVAAGKAQQALKDVTKLEVDQVNRQVKLAKLKAVGSDTDIAAQTEIQDLIAERERIEAQATEKSIEIRNKSNSIAKAAEDKRLKAIDDIAKAETKAAEEKIKQQTELIDKQIQGLELARQLELATIDETNEQKLEKERELLDSIGALRVEKAKLNGEEVATVELENKIAKAELEQEAQAGIDEKEKERLQANEDFKREVNAATADLIADSGKALLNGFESRSNREKDIELANLDAKLQGGLITQEEFEKKKLEIEKTAFNKKKKLDIAVIAIDLAKELSAIAAAAAANPANAVTFGAAGISQAAVLSGIAIARSAVQAGIVGSQKFSKGGVIHGASHAFGGVNLGNNQEAEGGEAIINKRSTAKHLPLLSAINQDGGGVALGSVASPSTGALSKFGNGGITNNVTNQSSSLDLADLEARIAASINTIKVQNVASETTGVANRVETIQDSASF